MTTSPALDRYGMPTRRVRAIAAGTVALFAAAYLVAALAILGIVSVWAVWGAAMVCLIPVCLPTTAMPLLTYAGWWPPGTLKSIHAQRFAGTLFGIVPAIVLVVMSLSYPAINAHVVGGLAGMTWITWFAAMLIPGAAGVWRSARVAQDRAERLAVIFGPDDEV